MEVSEPLAVFMMVICPLWGPAVPVLDQPTLSVAVPGLPAGTGYAGRKVRPLPVWPEGRAGRAYGNVIAGVPLAPVSV